MRIPLWFMIFLLLLVVGDVVMLWQIAEWIRHSRGLVIELPSISDPIIIEWYPLLALARFLHAGTIMLGILVGEIALVVAIVKHLRRLIPWEQKVMTGKKRFNAERLGMVTNTAL